MSEPGKHLHVPTSTMISTLLLARLTTDMCHEYEYHKDLTTPLLKAWKREWSKDMTKLSLLVNIGWWMSRYECESSEITPESAKSYYKGFEKFLINAIYSANGESGEN